MESDFIHSFWRPISVLFLIVGLVIMAVAETAGVGEAPVWFLGFAIPAVSALLIERGVRKGK